MPTLPPQFVEIVSTIRKLYVTQFPDTLARLSEQTLWSNHPPQSTA